jgi:hypothetical protein
MGTRRAPLAQFLGFSGMSRDFGPAAGATLTVFVLLAAMMPDRASAAPSRDDEATDELFGGQTKPKKDEPTKQEKPAEKPTEKPSEAPASQPRSEPAEPVAPTSSKAPGSERSAEAGSADEEDASTEAPSSSTAPDEQPEPASEGQGQGRSTDPSSKSHYRQGSLSIMPGWGFSAIVPYQKRIFCGEFSDDPGSSTKRKSFCTMGSPWFLEFTGGYGVHPRVDVVLGVRLHVQKRDYRCRKEGELDTCKGMFNDSLAVGLAPGIRAWISDPERMFKIGGAVDFVWMHERYTGYRRRGRCQGPNDTVNGPCPVEEPIEGYDDARSDEASIRDDDIGFRLGPVFQLDPHRNVGIFLLPAARVGLLRWFEFSFDIALGVQARFP